MPSQTTIKQLNCQITLQSTGLKENWNNEVSGKLLELWHLFFFSFSNSVYSFFLNILEKLKNLKKIATIQLQITRCNKCQIEEGKKKKAICK